MSILEITKLVNKINDFTTNASGDIVDRNVSVASIVGGVIGTQLPLPSSPVKNRRLHYQDQVYPIVANYISEINEAYSIDIEIALECAYLIWVDRYTLVHATRIDVTDMIYRLNCVSSFQSTTLDLKRVDGLSRVLDSNDAKLMNSVFFELIKQIQPIAED